ncbi:Protein kinase superfamily protein [Raphanus sativus]|uniref:cyclin-dependent kinase n=1 Tax=Raphanus sativus TaxID=3726 RepID=A0A6J0KCI1_RAPSA|nr:cyclin-dependent kinase G-2 [Raphanus sativus]KAJ4884016.1 Protein kinase superfamily protein [Raphanus sativus]
MAARRNIRYPDHELRGQESNSRFSRRDSSVYSNENCENNALDNGKGRVSNLRHGDSVKDRDTFTSGARQREAFLDRGPRRCGLSAKSVDREPGELSSESGSDDLVGSESVVKDNGAVKQQVDDRTAQSPVEKKRKYSPIVWDRDEHERSSLSRNEKPVEVTPLPPPPPLVKRSSQSPTVNMLEDPKQVGLLEVSAPTLSSPVEISSSCVVEQSSNAGKDRKQEDATHLEDEENMPTRHISSSRWAAGNSSPADEGEIVEVEINKRRKKLLPGSLRDKSLTPEAGESVKEGRSSDSDERRHHSLPGSRDDFEEKNAVKGDYMEIDEEERRRGNTSDSLTETDSDDEYVRHETPEPAGTPLRSINMLQGCRSVDEFERLNKIDEGTYGVVYRAKDKKTGEIVALKKVKMEKEREGFPLTALREINILLSFHHPSIVDVKEVVVGSSLDSIFMVMEYMEHDLKALMETMKQRFSQSEVKCLMLQLLEGVKYLHDNWVLHRDLKTSNLLLNNRGELKICDFGLARQYGSPLKPYTHLVVTLWYRAPELLLGAKQYSTAIDMWSLGCIMAELLAKAPLFNGKTEFDQLDKIFRVLGTPNESIWPGFSKLPGVKVNFVKHQYNLLRKKFPATSFTGSPVLSDAGFDLLNKLLTYDPERRITVDAALKHEWFSEVPLPKSKDFMPTFPAQHAQDRRGRRMIKSPDPLEEQRRKDLTQTELGSGGLFG